MKKWLEALHDRRHHSESLFRKRKKLLADWTVVCSVRKELEATEKKLIVLRELFMRNTTLGDSTATAEMLLFEHNKLQPDCKVSPPHTLTISDKKVAEPVFACLPAPWFKPITNEWLTIKEMQERTLKLTRWTEELQSKEHVSSEELRSEAYLLLEKCGDYVDTVDQRTQLLTQSILFFRVAHTALTKLDQLEVQLTAHQNTPGSQQLAQLHAQVLFHYSK